MVQDGADGDELHLVGVQVLRGVGLQRWLAGPRRFLHGGLRSRRCPGAVAAVVQGWLLARGILECLWSGKEVLVVSLSGPLRPPHYSPGFGQNYVTT